MAGAARVGQARSLGATRSPPGTGLTFIMQDSEIRR